MNLPSLLCVKRLQLYKLKQHESHHAEAVGEDHQDMSCST